MSTPLDLLAAMLGLAVGVLAISALGAGGRAVAIGGGRLLVRGHEWFVPSDRVPAAACPHMRRALWRWLGAMVCLVLAGSAAMLAAAAR